MDEGYFKQQPWKGAGQARAEVNLHAMTAGVAMLSLYCWLVGLKQQVDQFGSSSLPAALAIVTDKVCVWPYRPYPSPARAQAPHCGTACVLHCIFFCLRTQQRAHAACGSGFAEPMGCSLQELSPTGQVRCSQHNGFACQAWSCDVCRLLM